MNDLEDDPIADVARLLARLPGFGPRSARRATLHMLTRREEALIPLIEALSRARARVAPCEICGNLDITSPCRVCADPRRDSGLVCVVERVGDLWAMERASATRGRYHVLGGALSMVDGVGPEGLRLAPLLEKARSGELREAALAMNATMDGQTTAYYLASRLRPLGVKVSRLARGLPVGGELDYMDDATLRAALDSRAPLEEEGDEDL